MVGLGAGRTRSSSAAAETRLSRPQEGPPHPRPGSGTQPDLPHWPRKAGTHLNVRPHRTHAGGHEGHPCRRRQPHRLRGVRSEPLRSALRRNGEKRPDAPELASVFIDVEQHSQRPLETVGMGSHRCGDMAEQRCAALGIGGAPTTQPAPDHVTGRRWKRPGALVPERCRIQAGIQHPCRTSNCPTHLAHHANDVVIRSVQPSARQVVVCEPFLGNGQYRPLVVDPTARGLADQGRCQVGDRSASARARSSSSSITALPMVLVGGVQHFVGADGMPPATGRVVEG